jgi:asparagine synthase (glutamine-hydrolysing)
MMAAARYHEPTRHPQDSCLQRSADTMCGIAGYVRLAGGTGDPVPPLEGMADLLRHRGPDDHGVYRSPRGEVGFAHRRLSIIDLSSAGHQPMCTEDGALCVVYNGEIYNYAELDQLLESRGHRFRSRSDTETILHAYREWGPACVEHFNGMFSFALWDDRQKLLFCARDRFGEKPFYYNADGNRLAFASEIKALFLDPSVPRAVNRRVLHRYLVDGLLDADSETFFTGIRSLPPAHSLTVREGRLSLTRYWGLPGEAARERSTPGEALAEELVDLLRDSVRLRLRSDVPVGTCLSGGLDSSSIIWLMSRLQEGPISAFSVIYEEPGFDEGPYVRAMHGAIPLDAHEVRPDGSDLPETLERIIWHNDEPSNSLGQYSQWHVMRLASEFGVKVLLNGQGGDELLGGYLRYIPTYARELVRRRRLRSSLRELRGHQRLHGFSVLAGAKQVLYPLVPGRLRRAYRGLRGQYLMPESFLAADLAAEFAEPRDEEDFSTLQDHLSHDLTVTSVPSLVHAEDRCSMAFSREIRLPFLDHRLVEFMHAVPAHLKIHEGATKVLLRLGMAKEGLPERVRERHDKKGYPTPVGRWLRTSARSWATEILSSPELARRGFVAPAQVKDALRLHMEGRTDSSQLLWRWLCAELWARQFLDATASPASTPRRAALVDAGNSTLPVVSTA